MSLRLPIARAIHCFVFSPAHLPFCLAPRMPRPPDALHTLTTEMRARLREPEKATQPTTRPFSPSYVVIHTVTPTKLIPMTVYAKMAFR